MKYHADNLPVVIGAPHSSGDLGIFADRSALTSKEQKAFSDYGTGESLPGRHAVAVVISDKSRGLGDKNRHPGADNVFADKNFAKPEPKDIWLPGKELTVEEKADLLRDEHGAGYHDKILRAAIKSTEKRKTLVISWHNTADYEIGTDSERNTIQMPDIVLSNRGTENSASSNTDSPTAETVSCDPLLLEALKDKFASKLAEALSAEKGEPVTVGSHVNYGFYGGYDTQHYSSARNRDFANLENQLQALQVEYNAKLTHNQETLEEIPGRLAMIKEVFEDALYEVLLDTEIKKLGWDV